MYEESIGKGDVFEGPVDANLQNVFSCLRDFTKMPVIGVRIRVNGAIVDLFGDDGLSELENVRGFYREMVGDVYGGDRNLVKRKGYSGKVIARQAAVSRNNDEHCRKRINWLRS